MAHIRSGSIVSDIRGKVGTEIYSRNRGGAYVKAYAAPVQPGSSEQMSAQSDMATAVAAWQALTPEERRQWNSFVNTHKAKKNQYFPINRSGYSEFISRKKNVMMSGTSSNPSPVIGKTARNWRLVVLDINTTALRFNVIGDFITPTFSQQFLWIAQASGPVSPGITSINSVSLTNLDDGQGINSFTFDITSEWEAKHGSLAASEGLQIFLRYRIIAYRFTNTSPFTYIGSEILPSPWTSGIITS